MAHSSSFRIHGYEDEVVIIHNGDWSGDATIVFREKPSYEGAKQKPSERVTIPAKLLIGLALPAAKQFVMQQIQSSMDKIDVSEKPC